MNYDIISRAELDLLRINSVINAMPFKSKAQMRAAFGGYLGGKMKKKAKEWAKETPNIKKLPKKVKRKK